MYWRQKVHVIIILILFSSTITKSWGQDTSQEFWPELDIWYKLTPSWRVSSFIPFSRNVETNYREGSFIIQADYSFGKTKHIVFMRMLDQDEAERIKSHMIRGGYLSGVSLGDGGENYSENTAFAEYHKRIPAKGSILLSHRFRADLRWLGVDNDFSKRFRYRFMIEKEFKLKKVSCVPYLNGEVYYDSRFNTINRFRAITGTSVSWSDNFALETNLTYQRDNKSSVRDLFAVGLIVHLYFERKAKTN